MVRKEQIISVVNGSWYAVDCTSENETVFHFSGCKWLIRGGWRSGDFEFRKVSKMHLSKQFHQIMVDGKWRKVRRMEMIEL